MKQWAATLSAVVLLDAPDAILAHRIRNRAKPHPMKDRPDRELYEFLASFRVAFERVISGITRENGTELIILSTEQDCTDRLADKVWATFVEDRGTC
jgi:hypothetical protein